MKKYMLIVLLTAYGMSAEVNLNSCKGCHGQKFEKAALGKSKIVSKMSEDEVANAMVGYKNGTYGGPMKGLMKGQVMKHTEDELRSSAKKITELVK